MLLPDPQQPEHLIPSTHSATEASVQRAGSEREAVAWAIMLESSIDPLWNETAENYTCCIRAVDVQGKRQPGSVHSRPDHRVIAGLSMSA